MNDIEKIILAASFILLMFSGITVLAMRKPLRIWGLSLLAVSLQMWWYYPEQRIPAGIMLVISAIYFLRAAWIFAYRTNEVLKNENEGKPFGERMLLHIKAITIREWIGRVLALFGAIAVVLRFFPFQNDSGELQKYLAYILFAVLLIFYTWQLFHIMIFRMIAPMFVRKVEIKTARPLDSIMIMRHIGKGVMVSEPYLFFGKKECYIGFRRNRKQMEEITGYICEYTIYTDIFGNEYMMQCPKAISGDRKVQRLVYAEDLKSDANRYMIENRLYEKEDKKKAILPVLLGFILPALLIAVTMLLLYLFGNVF